MAVKILVPYNFTRNDEKAVKFVGQRYNEEKDIEITLFHSYPAVLEIDVKNNPIMEKMKSNVSYLRQLREERRQAMEKAKETLMSYGLAGHQIHCLFQPAHEDIATDIIKLWKFENFDVIVLNRNPGSIVNYFSKSISKRITHYNDGKIGVHIIN
ncbi:MAG: hypothetical protein GY699_15505 [Desulfobacteraceae bacterium]|nr:hypothetical protein [Desulfobacteraceae bacterium]